ncbi:hypothetical protein OIV83_003739 [Microbotryomycetes sp. JL201]|nr:hypothetical protein OIV83_003739 [Microbotryomycetes sp. JL201]
MTSGLPEPHLTDHAVDMLRALARDLVAQRLAHAEQLGSDSPFDATAIVTAAAPLFAALNRVNRDVQAGARTFKQQTFDARIVAEQSHLRLQNLLFEQNHLEREIRKCQEYESEFQNLPLLPLSDLEALASLPSPPETLITPLPQDPHELMLIRLNFELAERRRFDAEKKELGQSKSKLVKENDIKKAKLEALEKQVDEFVKAAKAIQAKMHEEPAQAAASLQHSITAMEEDDSSIILSGGQQ